MRRIKEIVLVLASALLLGCGGGSNSGNLPEIEMVNVPGGTFTRGCTPEQGNDCFDLEKPTHQVTVGDFHIGKYEVTQALWKAVMGNNPSDFKGDDLPVENVSRDDAQEFINNLNAITGRTYRLPTVAEWEYAAQDGKANELGLHYMSGTVFEWCQDGYDIYRGSSQTDPVGSETGFARVLRGGSWLNLAKYARVAFWDWLVPGSSDITIRFSFRLALSSE
jgi:formylglycine-generating enzyme required for sulfatase activity